MKAIYITSSRRHLENHTINQLTALSFSIGILAGAATFFAVGPLSGYFFIWAATIPWAAYFALGANEAAFKGTITCSIFGVVMAWITAFLLINVPSDALLGFPLMAALTVTIAVIVMCLAASIPQLSTIPASVFGYSMTFAYLLQTPDKMTEDVCLASHSAIRSW
ncbi:DUF1097 domain-containing protein [Methylomicrobium lacus]|uniref:DUF1097 domain-containing protein n=1 Tax=Methylomicrobium lacus TaxID=136992 RepID=UPI001FE03386|nr:DUF1097 domain-containing protein [Methylomicrobium lacus]